MERKRETRASGLEEEKEDKELEEGGKTKQDKMEGLEENEDNKSLHADKEKITPGWCVAAPAKGPPAPAATHHSGVTHHPGVVGTPARCAETNFPAGINLGQWCSPYSAPIVHCWLRPWLKYLW